MTTYQLMQLSPATLRQKMRDSNGHERRQTTWALLLRDICLLCFAIVYIAGFSYCFGQLNGYVGLASFCMLLSIRFVNYGYRVTDSLGALAIVLLLMGGLSVWLPLLPIMWRLVLNVLALLIILRLTTMNPLLGNGGVYAFSYIIVTSMSVHGADVVPRGWALLLSFVICGVVLWRQHRNDNRQVRVWTVLQFTGWHDAVFRWQFRLAMGISIALFVGQSLHHGRAMWLGFAGMSALLPQQGPLARRAVKRLLGVVLGSVAFAGCVVLLPSQLIFILAPLTGFLLGLTPSYFWASVFNCFGALTIAQGLFGTVPATELRIFNNAVGLITALLIDGLLELVWQKRQHKQATSPMCEADDGGDQLG